MYCFSNLLSWKIMTEPHIKMKTCVKKVCEAEWSSFSMVLSSFCGTVTWDLQQVLSLHPS
jgi:hypothetical protein